MENESIRGKIRESLEGKGFERKRRKYSWRTNQFVGKIRESLEGKGFERKRREDVSSGVENSKEIFVENESIRWKNKRIARREKIRKKKKEIFVKNLFVGKIRERRKERRRR